MSFLVNISITKLNKIRGIKMDIKKRVAKIREEMKLKGLDGYFIPSTDPHDSEYVAERWSFRSYISGFTGSAGTVVVLADKAGLWTDGRYFLQAEEELKGSGIDLFKMGEAGVPSINDWVYENLEEGSKFGLDGYVVSYGIVKGMVSKFLTKKIEVVAEYDLAETVWSDRPTVPMDKVFELDVKFSGESRESKIDRIRESIKGKGDYNFISTLDDIAWILNLRGSDISYNPCFISYLLIGMEKVTLFVNPEKIPEDVKSSLKKSGVDIESYNTTGEVVKSLVKKSKVVIDFNRINYSIYRALETVSDIVNLPNPSTLMKAKKNSVEVEGMRVAHIKDGAAVVKFLHWIYKNVGSGEISELSASDKLTAFRASMENYVQDSFPAISGFKGNGAIIHYRVDEKSDRKISGDGLYLIDSGGQYFEGTTDITRVAAIGKPTNEEIRDYTLVLKGMVELSKVKFPEGTKGYQLDILARKPLWDYFLNYGHGTGHGVGHFLNVHEGPQNISPFPKAVSLEKGMIVSNEPGRYLANSHGIRIENLIVVKEEKTNEGIKFFSFETLTKVPIERDLVDTSLLSKDQIDWIDSYHKSVFDLVSPYLNEEEKIWLEEKTRPLS